MRAIIFYLRRFKFRHFFFCFLSFFSVSFHFLFLGSGDAQTLCITDDDNVWSWGDGETIQNSLITYKNSFKIV